MNIYVKPIAKGAFSGVFAFHLSLGKDFSFEILPNLIESIRAFDIGKSKAVYIEDVTSTADETAILTLLKTLKDYGYRIFLATDGVLFHTWYGLADIISVRFAMNRPPVGFKATEYIWIYNNGDPEPKVHEDATKYVLPGKETNWNVLWDTIQKAETIWNICPHVETKFHEIIKIGERK